MKLSVLMPVYNEKEFLQSIVKKVLKQHVSGIDEVELVMVDDCSEDGTTDLVKKFAQEYPKQIKAFYHEKNRGKGAAIQTAIKQMTGDICIVQDADLEYEPEDYKLVLQPIIDGHADCVYGSRFLGAQLTRVLFFWHMVGNKIITLLSNMCTNLTFTDIETCYKAFRTDVLKTIPIESNDFRFEVEITAKIAKRKLRAYEVGISYTGRTYDEGKKIGWVDGVKAIWAILWFNFLK